MRHFKNNNRRRFKNNQYDRGLKINNGDQNLNTALGNVSDFKKKPFHRNNFNSAKLIQKYSDLAREALSGGDKILYENYMQHAEHFVRLSENFSQSSNSKNNSNSSIDQAKISKINNNDTKEEKQVVTDEN